MGVRWWWSVAIVLAVAAVFGQTHDFGFIELDDPEYVQKNWYVQRGLAAESLRWLPTAVVGGNWHPLTVLSHMLDVELFGSDPGAMHVVSAGLHALNALLLFWWLARYSDSPGCAAFVALLFAVHPQRAESVAWISERKDVLCGTFWLLAMTAYARWTRTGALRDHALTVGLMALGAMAKSMIVTLPFALVLLDVWPLRRLAVVDLLSPARVWPRLREKGALFAVSALAAAIALLTQEPVPTAQLPLGSRLANVPVAYAQYLGLTLWPVDLSIVYPHPGDQEGWRVLGAALLLLGLTGAALRWARRAPYALVGWLFFLGVLVPVIGVVQVGQQALADRYTYLPSIGLYIAVAFAARDLWSAVRPARPAVLAGVAAVVLLAYGTAGHARVSAFGDARLLFGEAAARTDRNALALVSLGFHELHAGRPGAALEHFDAALAAQPSYARAHLARALALRRLGDPPGALAAARAALRLDAKLARAQALVGEILEDANDLAGAERAYRAALEIDAADARAANHLGRTLAKAGRLDEAEAQFRAIVARAPDDPEAWESLGVLAEMRGAVPEAADHYERALARQPALLHARTRLGWIRASARDPSLRDAAAAARHFRALCARRTRAACLDGLAAAHAEAGRFDEAARTAERAAEQAREAGDERLARAIADRAAGYRAGRPWRE